MLIFLMLAVSMGATIDRHFCGGKVVDAKMVLNEKRAACGMEQDGQVCTNIISFREKCCYNELSVFGVNDYSITSLFTIDKPFYSVTNILFDELEVRLFNLLRTPVTISDTGPPGFDPFLHNQQSRLCIFLI
jgi:hypothetical protein